MAPKIWLIRLENTLQSLSQSLSRIKRQHRLWGKHAVIGIVATTTCIVMITLLTGVLFFRNDVYITDDGYTKKYFTMKEDADDILVEFGYLPGEFDKVVHKKNKDGQNSIEIVKGFGVDITADGNTFTTCAVPGETYNDILDASDVEIGEFDVIITGENKIDIIRGFGVEVKADGESVKVRTLKDGETTVDEILKRADVSVGKGDIINMPFDEFVSQGDEVVINRVTTRERVYHEEIPYETSVEFSNLLAIGDTDISKGSDGEYTIKLREKMIDGVVVTSEVLSKKVTKEAVTKVITHGMALREPYSKKDFPEIRLENGVPIDYIAKHTGKATAYTAPSGAGTASGRRLEIGTVAVNPKIIPYGSLVYIMSTCGTKVYGAAIAADTGGFIHHTDRFVVVDVFMGRTSENLGDALRWGLQEVDVYVINSGIY
ncbi:MAG: ubiquitin-like domain-containing protein [Oscillospiraceae bacterium]|nr:ubiquitin-like domain-containing protein [Oscillospiraceae bacterium]